MPRNGKIIVDSNSVVIDINIDLPPDFTEDFNDMLHRYDHFNYGLLFDKDLASDYQVDDKRIYIKYDNLDLDDRIDIYLSYELQMLLGLSERRIQIIVKENETSEAYLEENVIRKEFDGELIGLYSQKFDYDQEGVSQKVDKGSDMLFNLDFVGATSISYKYEDGIRVKSKVTYQESETIDYLILPEKLILGTEYYNNRRCVISALNYKLETTMGLLDAVEVSYYENEYLVFKKYYARNLGLVAIDYGNGWDKIVKIDYTK